MTVCIAASCLEEDGQKIVLCSDTRIGSGLGSHEIFLKEFGIGHGWQILMSGDEAPMLALYNLYKRHFLDNEKPTFATIDERVKTPLFQRKKQLAEEYIRTQFSISHEDFIKNGKSWLPDDLYRDAIITIGRFGLNAQMVVSGFVSGLPEIYYTDNDGIAHPVTHFATIGSGEYLASSVLLRRGQNFGKTLDQTLYNVYEAKKYSESVGTVGSRTQMSILTPDGNCKTISPERLEELQRMYGIWGPREISENLTYQTQLF